ncbi:MULTISPECIES: porin [Halocynthiibacter]|uniref:Porin n=1 Tax=Halocynthiibacter halioticoli TaxID=2986804 RepID=A0AAE3IXB7_9RHOB|nr:MULTISPECIES: porin [Halocynthiibacter]MCV6823444.1 porin [Halocynthiibacter halioticoli]MCW4056445.1 porin [Halocynthiibacter sp. SDUM655004]
MPVATERKDFIFNIVAGLSLSLSAGAVVAQEVEAESPWKAYGQLNVGILSFDDGEVNTNYGLVDNDNSSTRIGVFYNGQAGSTGWTTMGNMEFQYNPKSTSNVSQINPDGGSTEITKANIRKIEIRFSNDQYGRVWLGQGSMVSDGIAGQDVSGTGTIAGAATGDSAGASLFRQKDGILSDESVGEATDHFNGLGRRVRLRYDTPEYNGFRGGVSYGQDLLSDDPDRQKQGLIDIAGYYAQERNGYLINGGIGYGHNLDTKRDVFSGSISGLHLDSGLSLTLAAGTNSEDGLTGTYGYTKVGWETDFFDIGSTAFSIDYYAGNSISQDGDNSGSIGAAVVQNLGYQQLWFTVRKFTYDRETTDYYDGLAVFGGTRLRF